MRFGPAKPVPPSWRTTGWRSCEDVMLPGVIEGAPRYLRCLRCYRLVTHGQIQTGGCICGYRKLNPCLRLTWAEILLLKLGWFPLVPWEREAISPLFASAASRMRARVLAWAA